MATLNSYIHIREAKLKRRTRIMQKQLLILIKPHKNMNKDNSTQRESSKARFRNFPHSFRLTCSVFFLFCHIGDVASFSIEEIRENLVLIRRDGNL